MINCILGKGQIANAIKDNLHCIVSLYDKGEWEDKDNIKCDYLHICIPYTNDFTNICKNAKKVFTPSIMIIHSTVKPGTSKELECLYSPVLGRHDDGFSENIGVYRKFIAGDEDDAYEVSKQFNIPTEYWGINTSELEYAKVMSTTQMYWYLIFNKYLEKDCENKGFNYQQVYFRWLDNYNAGIRHKHPKWERPMYTRMESELPGGHCLRPNIHLVDNEITAFLRAYEKEILYHVTKK